MSNFTDSLKRSLSIYLVPGLVFQSVIVGGGYGTGREIAQFFLGHGPLGGLMGMLVSCMVWGLILAIAFEFGRLTRSYDYKTFFKALLGRFWWLFEVIYLLIALLVLAVLGSAAGEIVAQVADIPSIYGVLALMALVGLLTYFGSKLIERVFVFWSVLLFITYFSLLAVTLYQQHGVIWAHLSGASVERPGSLSDWTNSWALDGVRYAAYNLNALAAILFLIPRFKTPRNALGAGALAGVLAIIPALFVFVTLLAGYPGVEESAIPVMDILVLLNTTWLLLLIQTVLFGTFIETGTGIIHAINERVAVAYRVRHQAFPQVMRAVIALVFIGIAVLLASRFGIIDLIARGYGLLSFGYILVVIVPLLTLGSWHITKNWRRVSTDNTKGEPRGHS